MNMGMDMDMVAITAVIILKNDKVDSCQELVMQRLLKTLNPFPDKKKVIKISAGNMANA